MITCYFSVKFDRLNLYHNSQSIHPQSSNYSLDIENIEHLSVSTLK